ncbi:hypothetical protein EJK55_0344 [Moraxella catarrhalis]|uniref:Uncharacterized protein n=1 Tax=Moraxella catarrhalis TaxID=480 RepID=A0A3S9QI44_MORCA|nr:hypothetical protein EJK53_0675 [Moraxella catarrhalis]EKF84169.1 hypothetical protein MCRH_0697 [Moraxella catarrhalis RH4]AZQ95700.1 hypothetical protein EJK48_0683 [Moraxella catarrhalis]RUO13521.1 hypothetical protein EJK54_0287 [Moraxella catarrhalis]RUO14738.1 hypothetical protein EJK49_1884 [Moraxella catarrhalis]
MIHIHPKPCLSITIITGNLGLNECYRTKVSYGDLCIR